MKNQKIEQAIVAIMFVVAMFFAFIQGTSAQTELEYENTFNQKIEVFDNTCQCYGRLSILMWENQLGQFDQLVLYTAEDYDNNFLTYMYTHNDYARVKKMTRLAEMYGDNSYKLTDRGIDYKYISDNTGIILTMKMVNNEETIKMSIKNTKTNELFDLYLNIISMQPFE